MASSKLSAKAARLDFSSLPGSSVAPPSPALAPLPVTMPEPGNTRPKTAPGAMMAFANDARSELMRENEQLRERVADADQLRTRLDEALGDLRQWDGAKAARLIDPRLIDASRFANRHEGNYVGPEYLALRAEIESAGGNVQPIKVRSLPVGQGSDSRYELVFGHRRHRACLELALPVLAVVDNLDDRALFIEMDRENRARKDLSAWEQGMMYRRALDSGLFPSNRKLAEAIGVDLSALGKALSLAELPDALVQAFPSPLSLQFRWAKPLSLALGADRAAVLAVAAELAQGPVDRKAKDVFERLVAAGRPGGVERFHPPAPLVLKRDGKPVGQLLRGPNGEVSVSLLPGVLHAAALPALAQQLELFLKAQSDTAD